MPRRPETGTLLPHLVLLAMIAIWGTSYSAVKIALVELQPFEVVALRFALAAVCLVPAVVVAGQPMRVTARAGVVTGLALLLGYALQTVGMTETTASMGGFLSGLIVLFVAVGGVLFLGARLRAATCWSLLLGLGGLVLLCARGADAADRANTLRGVLLQVGSSASYAAHILLISKLATRGGELAFCLWQLVVVAAGATALQAATGGFAGLHALQQPDVLASVLFMGLLATALAIAVQTRVQPRIDPAHVAVLFATQPAFAALGGVLLLGDRLGWQQIAGGGLIALGVAVAGRPAPVEAQFPPERERAA